MAKKSKIFNEIRNLQNQELSEQRMIQKLEKKIKNTPLGQDVAKTLVNPKGEVKMSEVLESFIAPYLEFVQNHRQRKELLNIAVAAWNLSILPESQRQTMLDSLLTTVLKQAGRLVEQETRELVSELIERKQEYFADNQRMIIDFQLQDLGDQWHLSVASNLAQTDNSSS